MYRNERRIQSLSESEVNSFFDDDGGDIILSGIHGK